MRCIFQLMTDRKLRQAIAAEAARLLQQRKEPDFRAARRKAARWFSRQRVSPADLPSYSEIQQEVFALEGLFSSERQHSALMEIRLVACKLLDLLSDFDPLLSGSAITGPILPGAEIELTLSSGSLSDVSAVLFDAGHRVQNRPDGKLTFFDHYPCVVTVVAAAPSAASTVKPSVVEAETPDETGEHVQMIGRMQLEELLLEDADDAECWDEDAADLDDGSNDDADYHPDFFPTLEMLLNRFESIRLDPDLHPEGDLLYHSLQVYELGLAELPNDEEFLLACLLHDVGVALDRRHPLEAAWQAIGGLVTERTWFFIENRAEAVQYLSTGRIRGALKRSEDFEELVLLAKFDLKGRVPGAQVGTIEEALKYIASLSSAWDDV